MKRRQLYYRIDVLNIFLLLLGIAFIGSAWKLWNTAIRLEILGPGGFPLIFSVIWVIGIASIIGYEIFKPQGIPSNKVTIRDIRTIRWILLILFTMIYIFTINKIGFVINSILYLMALMITFGATKKFHLISAIILSGVITLIVYVAYTMLFRIPLPGVM